MRVIGGIVFCTIGLWSAGVLTILGALPPKSVDYPYYGGDPGAMRYSTLTQINAKNAGQLKEVWRYDLGGVSTIENQPIVVKGILYGVGVNTVYALDATTGKSKWEYTLTSQTGRNPRGVTFWTDGKERRLIVAKGNLMTALDADTGKPIPSFGNEGTVDLNDQLRGKASENKVGMASPAGLYKDILITHGGVGETTPASPGDLRGWDVRTGKLLWTFHTIPHPGEEGYDSWPKDAYLKAGGANAWGGVSMDEKRGIVFAATGSAADDFYGGDRLGNNLYANSVIAIDATTGKKLWHFQAVHHDLWDADFSSPPTLSTLVRNGKSVDVVIATPKNGYIYIFNRVTGEPMFPIDEKPVPVATAPGDVASPTQPIPRITPPLSWAQTITENDLTNRTPEAHAAVLAHFKTMLSGPMFTPPDFNRETIVTPGFAGGVEWGGIMTDPVNHVAFFNSERIAWYTSVKDRTAPRGGGADVEPHSRYSTQGYRSFRDPDGYPATAPPWGTLTAVDLNTGKFLWNIPFGEYPELAAKGLKDYGSENYGAGVVTGSGILIIASAVADPHFKVYDTKTGKLISSTPLPFPGIASPATYMVDGRQYVAFATSTGRDRKSDKTGSMLVVYALPQ
ncbi:MAG: PQQ-binding-like beta-propeller repeat protein [Granulicella sp.]